MTALIHVPNLIIYLSFFQFVNFILVLYYFALQSYNSTCEEAWHSAAVDTFRCKHFDDARERYNR